MQAPATFSAEKAEVERIVDTARREGREHLLEDEAYGILAAYGIPVPPHRLATTADEAAEAAAALGFPVVLKVVSPQIVHKTEVGGVVLDLKDEKEVRGAYESLLPHVSTQEPHAELRGVLVTPFRTEGQELILGMSLDPSFGPVLMFGLRGVHVETFRDVVFRVPPVTEDEAREMIRSIPSYPLLEGVRGPGSA